MGDTYLLIANQLKDFHHLWSEKIKNSKTNSPKWIVSEGIVEELAPLLILANLLDKLGGNIQENSIDKLNNLENYLATTISK